MFKPGFLGGLAEAVEFFVGNLSVEEAVLVLVEWLAGLGFERFWGLVFFVGDEDLVGTILLGIGGIWQGEYERGEEYKESEGEFVGDGHWFLACHRCFLEARRVWYYRENFSCGVCCALN